MKLTSPQGEFELTILDYEYGDSPHFLERNWLLISLRARIGGHEYHRMAPLLSTWELELLRDWMCSITCHKPLSPKLTFVEPALTIRADSLNHGDYQFGIKLTRETTAGWQANGSGSYWLTVAADTRQVQSAISDLENQLAQFPVRN